MVHAHVHNLGKRLVGLFLLTLAAAGLSLVSVVTSAQPAAAAYDLVPTPEEHWLAKQIIDSGNMTSSKSDINNIPYGDQIDAYASITEAQPMGHVYEYEDDHPCYVDVRILRGLYEVTVVEGYKVNVSSLNRWCFSYDAGDDRSRHWVAGGGAAIDFNQISRPGGEDKSSVTWSDLPDPDDSEPSRGVRAANFAIDFIEGARDPNTDKRLWGIGQSNCSPDASSHGVIGDGFPHFSDPDCNHVHIEYGGPSAFDGMLDGLDRSYEIVPGVVGGSFVYAYPPANPDGSAHCYTGYDGTQGCFRADGSEVLFTSTPMPFISGSTVVDSQLSANMYVTWSPVPDTLTYQWYRGVEPIDGATSTNYTTTQDDIYQNITVRATGNKTGYSTTTLTSHPVTITADHFDITGAPVTINGTAKVGFVLTASSGLQTPDVSTTIEWVRVEDDGLKIHRAWGSAYTPMSSDIDGSIQAEITFSKQGYQTVSYTSSAVTITADHFDFSSVPVTISGTPKVEYTLTASSGLQTPDVLTTIEWVRVEDDGVKQHLAWGSTYTPTSSDIHGNIQAEFTFSKQGYETQTFTSSAVTIAGYDGYVPGAYPAAIFGTPKVGSTLTANTTLTLPPGGTTTIEWLKYDSTSGEWDVWQTGVDSVVLTESEAGARIQIQYTFDGLGYPLQSYTSEAVIVPYSFSSVPVTISGTPQVEYTLTASSGIQTPGVSTTIEWLKDGAYRASGSTLELTESDIGASITVRYTFSKPGYETLSYASEAVTIAGYSNYSFSGAPASISGTAKVEYTLSASSGLTTSGVSTTITWYKNGAYRATGSTLALTSSDIGASITVQYTFSKVGYGTVSYTSPAVTVAGYSNYSFSGVPASISGTAKVEYTLSASSGLTTSGVSTTITWYKNGAYRATGSTLALTSSDIGASITVRYTFDKQGYALQSYYSSAVTIAGYSNYSFSGVPVTISGTPKVWYRLTASSALTTSGVTMKYQWYRGSTPISGATGSTYLLTSSDRYQNIKVRITFDKLGYPAQSYYSATKYIT